MNISEITRLLDYDGKLNQDLTKKRSIAEVVGFISSELPKHLNDGKVISSFYLGEYPVYHGMVCFEFNSNGRQILQVNFTISEKSPEDNEFNAIRLFTEEQWQDMRKKALGDIALSDSALSRYVYSLSEEQWQNTIKNALDNITLSR